jgi:hypothetical protein
MKASWARSTGGLMLVCSMVWGCVSFADSTVEHSLPNDIAARNTFLPTATWKRHLGELAGSILSEMEQGGANDLWQLSTDRYLKSGAVLEETMIPPDEGLLIEVLTDNKADARLSLLAFGSASIGAKEKMSFTYRDTTEVFAPGSSLDLDRLRSEAGKPNPPGVKARYVIQAALLSSIQRKKYTEVEGTFKKTVNGSGIGADGSIYSSDARLTHDYAIHLTLRKLSSFQENAVEFSTTALASHVLGDPGDVRGVFAGAFSENR